MKTILAILIATLLRLATCIFSPAEEVLDDMVTWPVRASISTFDTFAMIGSTEIPTFPVESCSPDGDKRVKG